MWYTCNHFHPFYVVPICDLQWRALITVIFCRRYEVNEAVMDMTTQGNSRSNPIDLSASER
jgi:hypothetical protein